MNYLRWLSSLLSLFSTFHRGLSHSATLTIQESEDRLCFASPESFISQNQSQKYSLVFGRATESLAYVFLRNGQAHRVENDVDVYIISALPAALVSVLLVPVHFLL